VYDEFKVGKILIGKNCWIGAGTIILKNTVIGEGSVIAAGTIVTGNIPPHSIVKSERKNIINPIISNVHN
jgi:acetyltransferase-like isoleucine patch superfamily enzyme